MKRFRTLILISFSLFISCDNGTKHVENQLAQENYPELINFAKTNADKWSKKSGVKLALSALSKEYYNDEEIRLFFEEGIYQGSSELIQEYGIGAIIANCDSASIMDLFKHIAQKSVEDNSIGNKHLLKSILGYNGKVCSDVKQMIVDFNINFVKAKSIIDSLENEISLLTPSILNIQSKSNYLKDRISDFAKSKPVNKCFGVIKRVDGDNYEAMLLPEYQAQFARSMYPRIKGSMEFSSDEHVILNSSSGEIDGKGLVCLEVSLAGATPITTVDGFSAKWEIYQEKDLEKYQSQKMDYLKQTNKLRKTLNKEQAQVTRLSKEISDYKKNGEKYSGHKKLTKEENTEVLKSVSRIPMPPVSSNEVAVIETDFGRIVFTFDLDNAPIHASNFKRLSIAKYFDGTTFHRVISDFMIQGGDINSRDSDPTNDGMGGPGYTIEAEIHNNHKRGSIAAARTNNPEKRSSGSQFYICHVDIPHLDGLYTVFGQIIEGMDVVDKIAAVNTDQNDRPLIDVVMKKVYITRMSEL